MAAPLLPVSRARALAYAALLLGGAVAPIALAPFELRVVGLTYPPERRVFELLACTGTLALFAVGALELQRLRGSPPRALVPLLAFLAVVFSTLAIVTEFAEPLYDWRCYEAAAQAIRAGDNPWTNRELVYLYPPLLAQALALAYAALAHLSVWLGLDASPPALWRSVFYLFQAAQPLLAALAFLLAWRLARDAGGSALAAALLAASLLLVDNPLLRTLRWSQINLWVLDLALLAILLRERAPLGAGLALALGAHLKLYPLVLLAPWLATRQWRAAAGAAFGLVALALLETRGGTDWSPWREFIAFAPSFPRGTFFRDDSLHSVALSLLRMPERVTRFAIDPWAIEALVATATAAVAALFAWRFLRRERAARSGPEAARFRQIGHAADALAFTLIAAPTVWEHHYVLAIPIAVWAAVGFGAARPIATAAALVAIFAPPVFDVWPFGYHRLAGLVLLLWVTRDEPPPPSCERLAPGAGGGGSRGDASAD